MRVCMRVWKRVPLAMDVCAFREGGQPHRLLCYQRIFQGVVLARLAVPLLSTPPSFALISIAAIHQPASDDSAASTKFTSCAILECCTESKT